MFIFLFLQQPEWGRRSLFVVCRLHTVRELDYTNGDIPVVIDAGTLERWIRYHAGQDRAYQRASVELQKRKKARQLAKIGFASQKRLEAEESRKTEKHTVQMATAVGSGFQPAAAFPGGAGADPPAFVTVFRPCQFRPAEPLSSGSPFPVDHPLIKQIESRR